MGKVNLDTERSWIIFNVKDAVHADIEGERLGAEPTQDSLVLFVSSVFEELRMWRNRPEG